MKFENKYLLVESLYPGYIEKMVMELHNHLSVFYNGWQIEWPEEVSDKLLDPSMPIWNAFFHLSDLTKVESPSVHLEYTPSEELKKLRENFVDEARKFAIDFLCPDFGEGETLALPENLEAV